jgi:hypothetical protein
VNRGGGLGRMFPLPLVGIALLLAVLIVLTPILTANGQPTAGSIYSQAILTIDALPGNASVHFYIRGEGTTARYQEIRMGFASGFNWTGGFPSGRLNWTDWENASAVLSADRAVNQTPVAVNVSALYSANGVNALYVGVFAVEVGTPPGSSTDTLTVISDTSGISSFTYPVASLPIPVPLSDVGSVGGP